MRLGTRRPRGTAALRFTLHQNERMMTYHSQPIDRNRARYAATIHAPADLSTSRAGSGRPDRSRPVRGGPSQLLHDGAPRDGRVPDYRPRRFCPGLCGPRIAPVKAARRFLSDPASRETNGLARLRRIEWNPGVSTSPVPVVTAFGWARTTVGRSPRKRPARLLCAAF